MSKVDVGADWRLVAPWYRWQRLDGLEPERAANAARPALHKFVSTDFVEEFLDDPQRSVVFDPDIDVTQDLVDLWDSDAPKQRSVSSVGTSPSDTRKLFLPAHQRFYLVAAGLHCDRPGFPRVDPDGVAEVGFVIRRQRVPIGDDLRAEAARKLQALTLARAKARTQTRLARSGERARALSPFRSSARQRVGSPRSAVLKAHQGVAGAKKELQAWAALVGLEAQTEGWVASGEGTFGSWVSVPVDGNELTERTYPMRLLKPNPDDPDHAAQFDTIYWSAIPTATDEITFDGDGRFNEQDEYTITAYARVERGGCPGRIVWSEPSEPFKLASFFDPEGCSQRPIEIRLPDFSQLEATSAKPSVKMSAPPASSPGVLPAGQPLSGQGAEICFFFIPLITIVAMFLLSIILPIVVFVFQLWWMLKLKLCIPPSIDLEVELTAALELEPGEFTLDMDLDVEIGGNGDKEAAVLDVFAEVFNPVDAEYRNEPPAHDDDHDLASELSAGFTFDAMKDLAIEAGFGDPLVFGSDPIFTERVRFEEVVHP